METYEEWAEMTTEELLDLYSKTGELAVKQAIVLRYTGLIKSIALQMRNVYISFSQIDDILNEGVIVLMNAIDKYDSSKNAKFETYISKRIKGMIIDLARKQDWIPRSVRKRVKDVEEAVNVLHNREGKYPSEEEVAEYLNIPVEKYHEIMKKAVLFNVLSLDIVLAEKQDSYSSFQMPQGEELEQPEKVFLRKEISQILVEGIHKLKEKEQLVISLYYVDELNMKQIAEVLEVSEPRVSQIHSNAIKKLRKYMETAD